MGLLSNIFKSAKKRGVFIGTQAEYFASRPDIDYGVTVTNQSAMNLTAFFDGIRIISENIASLPKEVFRSDPEKGFVEAHEHAAFAAINVRPNSYTNVFDFWSCIVTWLIGWGNAYAIIRRDSDGIHLYQVHPLCMIIRLVEGRKWYRVTFADPDLNYLNGTYSDEEILHFMLVTTDGIKGQNPVLQNAIALGKALATEKFGSEYFAKGGNIRAVMETEGHLGDEDYNNFMKHFGASSQNFETPLLEYGIKYKQLSVNPVAAQLIQSETFSVQDIARILNIPPHMLAELSHATYSNIEHQTIQFVKYTLRPLIKRIEVELESKLFFSREVGVYNVKFVLDGLLRGDTEARSKYYHNAILDGYMSRNEVRKLEGMTSTEGLDVMLYPQNESMVSTDSDANELLLAQRLGVGGTQALVSILQDENLTDEQKKGILKLLFSFTDEELNDLFPKGGKSKKDDKDNNEDDQ